MIIGQHAGMLQQAIPRRAVQSRSGRNHERYSSGPPFFPMWPCLLRFALRRSGVTRCPTLYGSATCASGRGSYASETRFDPSEFAYTIMRRKGWLRIRSQSVAATKCVLPVAVTNSVAT